MDVQRAREGGQNSSPSHPRARGGTGFLAQSVASAHRRGYHDRCRVLVEVAPWRAKPGRGRSLSYLRRPPSAGPGRKVGSHMAKQWFHRASEGQASGPVDSAELRRLAKAGIVRPDTLVRRGDSARWVRAEQVRGLFQPSTPAPSSTPATLPLPTPVPQGDPTKPNTLLGDPTKFAIATGKPASTAKTESCAHLADRCSCLC